MVEAYAPRTPQNGSTKVRLMALMQRKAAEAVPGTKTADNKVRKGSRPGYFGTYTPRQMAHELGVSEHDVVHALHDLKKQNLVIFGLSKATTGSTPMTGVPVRIKLTRRGLDFKPEGAVLPGEVDIPEPSEATVTDGLRAPIEAPFIDQSISDAELDEAERTGGAYTAKPSRIAMSLLTPALITERWPTLAALMAREERVRHAEAAARELELAGLEDLALQTLSAFPDPTPEQREVIDLLTFITQ